MTTSSNNGEPRKRITVLFVQTQSYFGADSQIHASIAEHLDRDRFHVIVACNDGAGGASPALDRFSQIPNTEVIPLDFGPSRGDATAGRFALEALRRLPFVWGLVRLARIARARQVDVVHGTEKPRDVLYGYLIGKACGAKTITQLHVKVEDWIKPLTRRVMGHNDALVGVSRFVAQSALDMGYRPERINHVLNALEIDRWQPDHIDVRRLRDEFGVDDDTALLAIIARVFPWKGHEKLIRALALVRDRGLSFRLLVVGDDDPRATPGGGAYSADLRRLVTDLGLADHVLFTGFRTDVPALMASIDVLAMPSFEEPFGMVYLEALAMRTPVVALRSGGVVEFIEHGVTGLLSDPDDSAGLADNLASLIADRDLRRRIGENGRQMVLRDFASPRMARDMEAVYRSILDGSRARST